MILAIDPGYRAMGWAVLGTKHPNLYMAGVLAESRKVKTTSWHYSVRQMQLGLRALSYTYHITDVVVEEMQIMGGTGGFATARTSLMGLAGTVGMWASWAYQHGYKFHLAPIPKWKGQMKKQTVAKRIRKILSKSEVDILSKNTSHDWDAVGIGLWFQGSF